MSLPGTHFDWSVVPVSAGSPAPIIRWATRTDGEIDVLDVLCVLGIIALGVVVALVGRGVEKL